MILLTKLIPDMMTLFKVMGICRSHTISLQATRVRGRYAVLAGRVDTDRCFRSASRRIIGSDLGRLAGVCGKEIVMVSSRLEMIGSACDLSRKGLSMSRDMIHYVGKADAGGCSGGGRCVRIATPVTVPKRSRVHNMVLTDISASDVRSSLSMLCARKDIVVNLIVVFLAVITIFTTSHMMHPLRRVTTAVRGMDTKCDSSILRISAFARAGDVDRTVGGVVKELGLLSSSERRFMSGMSRRLGAPVASVGMLTSSLLRRRGLPIRVCRRFVNSVTGRVSHRGGVVASLLSLIGVSGGNRALGVRSIGVGRLLRRVLGELGPVTRGGGIRVMVRDFQPIATRVSRAGLSLTVSGLMRGTMGCGRSGK